MKLYLAGPMDGRPNFNFDSFNGVAEILRAQGIEVFNPAEEDEKEIPELAKSGIDRKNNVITPQARAEFLKRDFQLIAQSDGLVLLSGWEHSQGANCELKVALMLGLQVFLFDPVNEENPLVRYTPRPLEDVIHGHILSVMP